MKQYLELMRSVLEKGEERLTLQECNVDSHTHISALPSPHGFYDNHV